MIVALVCEHTLPTEGAPLVRIVPTFADRGVSRGQRGRSPAAVISVFLAIIIVIIIIKIKLIITMWI
jgi:hypothetical protein